MFSDFRRTPEAAALIVTKLEIQNKTPTFTMTNADRPVTKKINLRHKLLKAIRKVLLWVNFADRP